MIPRVIHQIWIGPPEPEHIHEYRQGWVDLHPNWDYILWDERSISDLLMVNQNLYDQAESYCLPGRLEQFRSDIARYEILLQHGGLYVDADFEPRRPVDELMSDPAWMAWEIQKSVVSNAILGAHPAHPFIADLAFNLTAHVQALVNKNGAVSTSRLSGPRYLTSRLKSGGAKDIKVRDQNLFFPYGWDELDRSESNFPEAYAVHHWQNQRRIHKKERLR